MIRHYIRLYIILYYTIAGAGRPADGHHYYRPPRHHSSAWVPGWRRRPFLRFPRCSRLLSPHAHTFRYFSLFIYFCFVFFCYLAAPSAADIYKTHSLTWKSASGIIIYLCSTKKEKGTYILGTECRKNRRKKSVRSSVFFFFFFWAGRLYVILFPCNGSGDWTHLDIIIIIIFFFFFFGFSYFYGVLRRPGFFFFFLERSAAGAPCVRQWPLPYSCEVEESVADILQNPEKGHT